MSIEEAVSVFFSYLDRVRDEGYLEHEISMFLNIAQRDIFKHYVYNFSDASRASIHSQPKIAMESVQQMSQLFSGMIVEYSRDRTNTLETDDKGILDFSVIRSGFPDSFFYLEDESDVKVFKPTIYHVSNAFGSTNGSDFYEMEWVRHNEYPVVIRNPFKRPTNNRPIYRLSGNRMLVDPRAKYTVELFIFRMPLNMWYFGASDPRNKQPELPDAIMDEVIKRAAQLATMSNENFNKMTAIFQDEQR